MSGMIWALAIPAVVFMIFVAPLWLFLHYRNQRHQEEQWGEAQQAQLQRLQAEAQQLLARVQTLEQLLEQDDPSWRARQ